MNVSEELKQCQKLIDLQLYNEAAEKLNCLGKALPGNYEIHYLTGRLYLEQGRFNKAITHFTKASQCVPHADAILRRQIDSATALAHAGTGNWEPAGRVLKLKYSRNDTAETLTDIGLLFLELRDYKSALKHFVFACAHNNTRALMHTANIFYVLGRPEKAVKVLETALRLNDNLLSAHALLGNILQNQGCHKNAAKVFLKAVGKSPNARDADLLHYSLANSLYATGKTGAAISHFMFVAKRLKNSPLRITSGRIAANLVKSKGKNLPRISLQFQDRVVQGKSQCVPTTISNILRYWGIKLPPEKIAKKIFTDGVRGEKISGFMAQHGMKTLETSGTVNLVKKALLAGIPSVIDEYFGLEGHLIAITGFDDNKGVFFANDPNFYDTVEITYQEFTINWRQNGNWMLLAAPVRYFGRIASIKIRPDIKLSYALTQHARTLQERAIRSNGNRRRKLLAESTKLAQEAARIYSRLPSAPRVILENLLIAGDMKKAAEFGKACVTKFGRLYWTWRYMGDIYLAGGKYTTALKYYNNAKKYFSGDRELFNNMSRAYYGLNNRKKTEYYLNKANELTE